MGYSPPLGWKVSNAPRIFGCMYFPASSNGATAVLQLGHTQRKSFDYW